MFNTLFSPQFPHHIDDRFIVPPHVSHHGINACLRFVRSLVLSPESSSPKSCLWFIKKGINHSHIHVKDIYINRKFPGID